MDGDRRAGDRTDVVVVGGGLAGLTAAVTAASGGCRVTLFDARPVGGRARSSGRLGFTLNEGAHALYRNGPALATLREMGVVVHGRGPDPAASRLVWDGEVVVLPGGPAALATTSLLSTRSKLKLGRWYASLGREATRAQGASVGEWLDAERAGADLRRFVLALMRLVSYAAVPECASAPALLRQLALGAGGVLYVDRGWQSIVDALSAAAATAGVQIVDHEAVTEATPSAAGWTVTTTVRAIECAAVVVAAGGPAVAAGLLGGDPCGWIERAGPPQRAAVLDVGGAPPRHTFLLSADEPLYLSAHAPVAQLAPPGEHLVTVMRYLADDDPGTALTNRAALDAHAALAGVPPAGTRTLERFLAAPVVTWGSPVPAVARPSACELADRGVLVAGDWVGEHLLADAAVASGRDAGLAAARRVAVAT